ncbi:MAG: hypothetical protein ACREJA_07255 [Candidatus Methylomirabilales bacterium]
MAIDLDPNFHFDLRHPFPGSAVVRERLWRRWKIAWSLDASLSRRAAAVYWCDASVKRCGPLHHDQFHTCEVRAVAWRAGASDNDPLVSEDVSVTIRSWLPLGTDVPDPDINLFGTGDLKQLDAEIERFKIRVEAIWFPALPGISVWDVAQNYAEYLGFRAIERWARGNL